MSVVVTGAAGFLGRALVASLAADGIPVVAVDRRPPPHGPGVTALRADLLDRDPAVTEALRRADAVFHLAGRPGVRDTGAAADAARTRDNVHATAAVLATVPPGPPLVVTSSSSVYGGAAGRPVAVLRPFTVAGEGQRADMALARWIAAVRAGEPIRILGSTRRTRDVTDVRDVVRAARLAAERGVVGPLNVGTGRPHTLAELAGAVCRVLGAPVELVVGPAVAVEPAATWADTTRLRRSLGFVPVTDLDDVVARQARRTADPAAGRAAAEIEAVPA
jgi:nucleoside-diphosphate-sugar epimerase